MGCFFAVKRMQRWSLVTGVATLALCASTSLFADFNRLGQLQSKGFSISAEARLLDADAGANALLGSITPDRQLSPASVTKAYLSAAALNRFGPQHRFTSQLVSSASIENGVLRGDLVFEGGGDPGLTTENLWRLVQRLHLAGVREVEGALVVSQWRFGSVDCITTDRCNALTRVANAYSAPLSSAGVNFGSWCVNVAPATNAGEPAQVGLCDSQTSLITIDNQVITRPANSGTEISAERITDERGDVMRLTGQISTNATARDVYRGAGDAAETTAQVLMGMLNQAGIQVREAWRVSSSQPPSSAQRLAAVDSQPLQELLLRIMNYSNNYMADVLALDLVETPQAQLRQAGQAIETYAHSLPGHGPLTLYSGSGLTTENRTSAQGVNVMLEDMFRQSSLFPSFVAAFQSPANGVMRFIRRGSSTFQNNVMIKTGTLNQPFAVRAAAGYFRTAQGRWGVFSVMVNGNGSTPYLSWTEVLDPLSQDLEAMMLAN
ncbi:D-alanyl-D-alanine carboxypeptidase/D-alanyl-D-alanine-endopeptidase [Vreelandella titanicae]|uniref:D-alanyl-D-alanine carboxypeptidase/D-alanyl-D-alanine endopeptidase n=1 Tax=Halomonadaceae TaxID=28256 RepID=UPI00034DD6D3|nr:MULTISPECIES: D-alanyl-D-alanine carboxypeptidase/D-alanyl-D-alanine-endopeptidase [Halomonas]NAO95836.1 D-alanyl-D-alanine carboxypeptidase/D-alanyl-D-alanine-endopeptidase [Halomonas sp. MG34]QGQ71397.1 D-alanyl-D-alanine carboxypeptidase/D-alanyl-D-alanine-endopeptidase [Halomonas sp. PA16-9]KIN13078.1 D-alanyl-D-alanine carboxypeptidase [Halomonas sp. KHS3]MCD1586794.1 D-alanyl-D-alanine carboxypeptidase/D-alanyl-D-alanine-endopeptidase [Halomonas sp. IOP_14]MCE7520118.1 D-alanyl-D-alan|tara:strand:+ start:1156 stop:2631 length:1476 start_codon:yes stop_codon:yes gene_type:complete